VTARAEEGSYLDRALAGLIVDTPDIWGEISVFPLVAPAAPAPLAVESAWATSALAIHDRTQREHEYDLLLSSAGEKPILVLGGTVVTGGKVDRLVPIDVLVPPKATGLDVDALTASARIGMRPPRIQDPLRVAHVAAPPYLRESAQYVRSHRVVRTFVSHFDAVRTAGEPATLVGVASAEALAPFCAACQGAVANFPRLKRPEVVGFVMAVGDRLQSLELFATNDLLQEAFEPMLAASAFRAAAIALRARARGAEPPKVDTEARLRELTGDAKDLLVRLRERARARVDEVEGESAGEALDVWVHGARGRALGWDGRLVHATVFPHDPFQSALFADPLRYEPEVDQPTEPGTAELERRAQRARLTPFEERLLERRRSRGP
jgi:hypothetical protein